MFTPPVMQRPLPNVPRKTADYARLADMLRDEAALEMMDALDGVSGKKIDAAAFPGISRHGVSRACNGDPSNPLYRIAALFLLLKRLGMDRKRAKRIVQWLDELIDQLWPPEEEEDGEPHDPRADLEAIRAHQEHLPRAVAALRRLVAAEAIR